MSNDKVAAIFHPGYVPKRHADPNMDWIDADATPVEERLRAKTTEHMTPDDPTAIPHAHLDEH